MDLTRFTKIANFIVECIKEATLESSNLSPNKSPISFLVDAFRASHEQKLRFPQPIAKKPMERPQMPDPQRRPVPELVEDKEQDKPKEGGGEVAAGPAQQPAQNNQNNI